ncbi:hypothetical protein HOE07_04795 [archaeon]|jgi:sugar-specific transcriptional regulator TrmB|nr:hypothetical protein [archaeon]
MDLEKNLVEIGLTQQEAKIYLITLKLGIAKASQISQKAKIQRGAAYYILKLLKEKGFLIESIKSGVKYYSAINPTRIVEIIEEERKRKLSQIKAILPELKEMKETAIEKPQVEIYEGYEGFKTIFSRLIEEPGQEFNAYLSANILDYLPHFHEQFRKRRSKKRIRIKTITEKTPRLKEIQRLDKKENRETKFLNQLFKDTEGLFYVLKDSVIFIRANKKEQTGLYIKDKNLASLHKNIFDQLWKQAKK